MLSPCTQCRSSRHNRDIRDDRLRILSRDRRSIRYDDRLTIGRPTKAVKALAADEDTRYVILKFVKP